MTHSWDDNPSEENRHRVGELYAGLNFGFVEIDWEAGSLALQIRDLDRADARDQTILSGSLAGEGM